MARPGRLHAHDRVADEIRQAIDESSMAVAISLIEKTKVDILDGYCRTPLIHAALAGNVDLLSWLIAKGANINHQDRNGLSALYFAVQEKHLDAIESLLANGAAVDARDDYGNTALWHAGRDAKGSFEVVKLLRAYGADPNSKNNSSRSPLDHAETVGDQELAALLRDE